MGERYAKLNRLVVICPLVTDLPCRSAPGSAFSDNLSTPKLHLGEGSLVRRG